jgi:hypothetical protein
MHEYKIMIFTTITVVFCFLFLFTKKKYQKKTPDVKVENMYMQLPQSNTHYIVLLGIFKVILHKNIFRVHFADPKLHCSEEPDLGLTASMTGQQRMLTLPYHPAIFAIVGSVSPRFLAIAPFLAILEKACNCKKVWAKRIFPRSDKSKTKQTGAREYPFHITDCCIAFLSLNPLHGRYAFLRILGQYGNKVNFKNMIFRKYSICS